MPRLFTISWPYFARLEAVLFFPPAVMLASGTGWLTPFVNHGMVQSLSLIATRAGLPKQAGYWADQGILMLLPWLVGLIVIDRIMTVRKGYAILSLLAVAVWGGAAYALSDRLEPFVVISLAAGIDRLPFNQQIALAVACVALVVHLKPLLTGLLDHGGVAARLLSPNGALLDDVIREYDPYHLQRPDMRAWQSPDAQTGRSYVPRENATARLVNVLPWLGVAGAAMFGWLIWSGQQPKGIEAAAAPNIAPVAGSGAARSGADAGGPPVLAAEPASPVIQAPNVYVPPRMAIPVVQRPVPLPAVVSPSAQRPDANAASAARGRDGHYTFDAAVNGVHMPMLFDTGASVVSLRAEDAVRMGFDLSELKFTRKMSTANGIALYAPIMIDTITVGEITEEHVPGLVAKPGVLGGNLLGQSFMTRLSGYGVENNQLILKGR